MISRHGLTSHLSIMVACALGCGLAGLFWAGFTDPFPLEEFCSRNRPRWVLTLFEQPRYTSVRGTTFLSIMGGATALYLLALWAARGLRGRLATALLVLLVPLLLVAVLFPGYPLLSSDIYKYIFDGRIMAVYGQNPFLHVPAEFPDDRFYDLVYWKAVVNAHGPLWRLAEAAAAVAGDEDCDTAVMAMKVWPTLAYGLTTIVLFAVLRTWQPDRAISGAMVYAWNPVVVLEAIQSGHNDVVAALPAVGAVWAAQRGRPRWTFPLLAVAALVKPLALALGPLLLIVCLRRAAPRDVAWGIALGGAVMGAAYWPFWGGVETLQGLSREHLFSTSPAKGLLQLLELGGVPLDRALPIATMVSSGLFLLLLVPLLWAAWRGRIGPVVAAAGVFFLYLLVGAQWFNPWYFLWPAPLQALVRQPQPRVLGLTFMLLAPIAYPVRDTVPILLSVFLPVAILAVRWRAWLGWSDSGTRGGPTRGDGRLNDIERSGDPGAPSEDQLSSNAGRSGGPLTGGQVVR